MRRRSILILGLPALLLVAAVSLPFTGGGTRVLLALVDRIPSLDLEYGGGVLAGELRLRRLRVTTDGAVVQFDGLDLALAGDCLWRGTLCLAQGSVRKLDVEVLLSEEDTPPEDPAAGWTMPFVVAGENLSVGALRVHWEGGELTSRDLAGRASIEGDSIHVLALAATGTRLRIPDPGPQPGGSQTELPAVEMPLDLVVDSAQLVDSAWDIHGERNEYSELSVSGHWRGALLTLETLRLVNPEWGEAAATGNMTFRHPYPLAFSLAVAARSPPVWSGLHGARGPLKLTGDLEAMTVYGHLCAALPLQLAGDIEILSLGVALEISEAADCGQLAGPLPVRSLPGLERAPEISVSPGWSLRLAGDTEQQTVALAGRIDAPGYPGLDVTLAAEHRVGTVSVQRLQATRAPSGESLTVTGQFGYGQVLHWDLDLQLQVLSLPPQLQPLSGQVSGGLRATGQARGDQWELALSAGDLGGVINTFPARLSGNLRLDQNLNLSGSELDLDLNGASVRLSADAGDKPRAELNIADVGRWLDGAHGRMAATLEWEQRSGRLDVTGGSSELDWQGLQMNQLSVDGEWDPRAAGFQLQATIGELSRGDRRLRELQLALSGDAAQQLLTIGQSGAQEAWVQVRGAREPTGWRGQLQALPLGSPESRWSLEQDVELVYRNSAAELAVQDHCWRGPGTRVCGSDLRLGARGTLDLQVAGSLDIFAGFLPARYRATAPLDGRIKARWSGWEIDELSADLELGAGRIEASLPGTERAEFDWEGTFLNYRGNRDSGRLQGRVRRRGADRLSLDLSLPASLDGSLSGSLSLEHLDLAYARPFVPRVRNLQGDISGRLNLAGRIESPRITGSLGLTDGGLALLGNPTRLQNVSLQARFIGDRALLQGELFVGDGRSDLSGELSWLQGPSLSLASSGEAKPFLYPPETVVSAAENLLLELTPERLSLTGSIDIPSGELVLDALPGGGVEISDDVVLFDGEGKPLAEPASRTAVEIDLLVRIHDQLKVRATDISGTLGGELLLRQQAGRPLQLTGRVDVLDGRFELLGPRFDVTRGQLSFVGAPDNPQLDVAMEREIPEDQVTVGIRVGGTLEAPDLAFYSRPAKPEAEVMAYALSGRGIDRSGTGNNLGLALAMTSGLMKSAGMMQRVSLGVEGRDRNTRAVIGGYISERIYLSYGVGVYDPVNVLTVRLDIVQRLWMEVVSSIRSSADVYYSWSR